MIDRLDPSGRIRLRKGFANDLIEAGLADVDRIR